MRTGKFKPLTDMEGLTERLLDLENDPNGHLFKSNSENESEADLDISPESGQIHRSVAALFIDGNTPSQIAVKLKLPGGKVHTILKQKHTQEVIKELMQGTGAEGVESILKATEVDNVLFFIETRDCQSAPHAVRINAAKELANMLRGGKPYSTGEDDQPTGDKLTQKLSDIDGQIKELSKKEL
jgi:hypothetical protein